MRTPRCPVCRSPSAGRTLCDACKAEVRRLDALHDLSRRLSPEADQEGRRLRVELYAAVVGLGGRLFE